MTVGELKARLEAFDPSLRVVMPSEQYDWCEVGSAFVDLVKFRGGTAFICDERDKDTNAELVVRLFVPDE